MGHFQDLYICTIYLRARVKKKTENQNLKNIADSKGIFDVLAKMAIFTPKKRLFWVPVKITIFAIKIKPFFFDHYF